MSEGFFEPPIPPPEHVEYRQPLWIGAPHNVVPGGLDLTLVLATTEDVAISLERFAAYPNGMEFDMVIRLREETDAWDIDEAVSGSGRHGSGTPSGIPPERLRFGVKLSDGAKVTNLRPGLPEGMAEPSGPTLIEHGGGGGSTKWDQGWWLTPLPPPGRVTFAVEWPIAGIPLSTQDVDGGIIREAARRATIVWTDEGPPSPNRGPWFVT